MTIISHKHRIVFFPLAKNCSSSVKHLFYRLETGMDFREAKKKYDLVGYVHKYYPTPTRARWKEIFLAYESAVIVRDPIKRFLSAYSNRLEHVKLLERVGTAAAKIEESGYPLRPTLDEFVEHLEFYSEASPAMYNHIAPQTSVIGHFFPKIKHVFDTSQIPLFESLISKRVGQEIVLAHEQSGGTKLSVKDLSETSLEKLVKFYKEDYRIMSKYYKVPS